MSQFVEFEGGIILTKVIVEIKGSHCSFLKVT